MGVLYTSRIAEVVLVGCGGTGSQAARTLCRVVYDLRRRGHHAPSLKFVDPDTIEQKNVGRQMFTSGDVGKFKAATLASRFNLALGLSIAAYAEPFDADKHASHYGTLVIGCVDNHLTRLELSKAHCLWLDCGNDRTSGQVTVGNTAERADVLRCIQANQFSYLPNAALLFPQLLEPEPAADRQPTPAPAASCADLVETAEQSLLVNDAVGIVAGEYLYKLLNRLPLYTFLTSVDTESLSMRSVPITAENLQSHLG